MRLIGKLVVIPTLFLVVTSMSVYAKNVSKGEHAKDVSKVFAAADTDSDGRLSMDEVASSSTKRVNKKVGELFTKFDANGDGCVTKDEMTAKKAQKLGLAAADTNNDGKLTKEESISFFQKKTSDRSAAAFKLRDANTDGFVTLDELKQFKLQKGKSIVDVKDELGDGADPLTQ